VTPEGGVKTGLWRLWTRRLPPVASSVGAVYDSADD